MECHCFSLHSNNPSRKQNSLTLPRLPFWPLCEKSHILMDCSLCRLNGFLHISFFSWPFTFSSSIVHLIPPLLSVILFLLSCLSSQLLVTSRPIDLPVFLPIFHFSTSSSLVFLLSSGCCCLFIPLLFCLSSPAACDRQLCWPTNLYRQM